MSKKEKEKERKNAKNKSYTEVNNYKIWNKRQVIKEFLQKTILRCETEACLI